MPRQERAAGDRRHDVLRVAPAELLDDLEPHRLRALGVVRPQVDVDEAPAVAIGHLRAQAVHIVVGAGDAENGRLEDGGAEHLAGFEIVGDEDVAFEPEPGGVRGDAVGEVAGRRAGQDLESQLDGARGGHRDDAILVGQRGMIDRVVLEVQLAHAEPLRQAIAAHERREAGIEPGERLAFNRQQLAVAPQTLRTPFNLLAA